MKNESEKFLKAIAHSSFQKLLPEEKKRLKDLSFRLKLTFQEIRQLIEISADFMAWGHQFPLKETTNKKDLLSNIKGEWEKQRNAITDYSITSPSREISYQIIDRHKKNLGLGRCPVSSDKTRCCQLYTLDAVDNCGQDCSYCSIQSFFSDNQVFFDTDFVKKLEELELDPKINYHIGTGQSSDSLMWGNRGEILAAIFKFARKWPNVIIELKTKSANIDYLLENDIPKNVISTWSLNPQIIIDNEEHGSSSLCERMEAAKKITDKGNLVGFHFHPMIHYAGWEKDYSQIITNLTTTFDPSKVAMVSFGTLTYTKNIIKKIRTRNIETKVLQIPFEEIKGKFSYPFDIKKDLFSTAYQSFLPWHGWVYFYMCMEDIRLWQEVFGFEYDDNEQFEQEMFGNYQKKITLL